MTDHNSLRAPMLKRKVLADYVYEEILSSLIDGRREPAGTISIDGLARELNVSQTPVREALARLEHTGMVRRVALKGYTVAPLSTAAELAQLVDARLVIEPTNAEWACSRATAELCDALRETIERLGASHTGATYAEFRDYWKADEDFHRIIAENADNPFVLAAYKTLGGQIQRFRYFAGMGVTDAESAILEHTAILQAFLDRKPERAREAMVEHLQGVKSRSVRDSGGTA
ncbi:GntR family transcriptional regulator [Cryobacterium melibiosiphilum]|uniref:GntR family transcriptional regulator n=1 Tax=Cryobacterium melibiosiphilum TaxID=995039 RepID=A0A3A5MHX3_9MICO|nr:GntR family transcriptional regulator [Cryobacterium melibiosiphilum]RJT85712.1 GntR family transcriptional regulator [Cryobacterium melibiosiphilum]